MWQGERERTSVHMSDLVSLCVRETILKSPHATNRFVTANSDTWKGAFFPVKFRDLVANGYKFTGGQ